MMKNIKRGSESPVDFVSIIVPVYNVEKYIQRCIDSLLVQSYAYLEVLLIEDGSTDGSGEICDKYASEYSNIKVVHIDNGGVSNARNIGLSLASGEYVTFVDGDDWLAEDFLETGVKALEKTGADIFMSSYVKSYEDGTNIKVNEDTDIMLLTSQECIEKIFVKEPNKPDLPWSIWGKIYKTSLWKNVRFDTETSMGEDAIAFWDVLKNANQVIYKPIMGYYYFQRIDSAMHIMSTKHIIDALNMYEYFFVKTRNIDNQSLKGYFSYRYYMARIDAVCQLANKENVPQEFYDSRKMIFRNILEYFCAARYLRGFKGVLKTIISILPRNLIVMLMKLKD